MSKRFTWNLDEVLVTHPEEKGVKYSDDEARDEAGRWTSGGAAATFYSRLAHPDGGFTVSATTGEEPTGPGHYGVSPYPDAAQAIPVEKLTPKDLAVYVKNNLTLLTKEQHYFGGWHDPETHMVYLDVSKVVSDPKEAERLAKDHAQLAYFDFGSGKSVRIDAAKAAHFKAAGTAHLALLKVRMGDVDEMAATLRDLFRTLTGRGATDAEMDDVRTVLKSL